MKDLIVLVPDKNVQFGMEGLLSRFRPLNMKQISYEIFVHPLHDPGVYHDAAKFLRSFSNQYLYALVFLDREGSGREKDPSEKIAGKVKREIERNGWPDRGEVIVFDPEMETWIWTESTDVAKALGWDDYSELKTWLMQREVNWRQNALKPERPKEAVELSLKRKGIPRSSSIYREIANNVDFNRCQDNSFREFRGILQKWFPKEK
jgi:hypothetical protein